MPPELIKVPKPPRGSYDPNRPLYKNTLLLNQVMHFKELEAKLPEEEQTGIPLDEIQTEAQASVYIQKMTTILHGRGGVDPQKVKRAT
jgi:hypothetical protein